MAEWLKAPASKAGVGGDVDRGFESHRFLRAARNPGSDPNGEGPGWKPGAPARGLRVRFPPLPLEKGAATYYFALQIGADDYGRAFAERVPTTRRVLASLGILD